MTDSRSAGISWQFSAIAGCPNNLQMSTYQPYLRRLLSREAPGSSLGQAAGRYIRTLLTKNILLHHLRPGADHQCSWWKPTCAAGLHIDITPSVIWHLNKKSYWNDIVVLKSSVEKILFDQMNIPTAAPSRLSEFQQYSWPSIASLVQTVAIWFLWKAMQRKCCLISAA